MASSLFGMPGGQMSGAKGNTPVMNPSQNQAGGAPMSFPPNNSGFQSNLAQIKNAMAMMKSGGNPQMIMESMIMNNPQYKSVMNLVQQYGGDAKAAFYALAEQKGVDPNEILNLLR